MNEKNNVKRKGYSGIWIFWSVLFGMISLVSVTSLLIMYIYFTNGKGYQPPAASATKEEAPLEDTEDILAKEEASGIPTASDPAEEGAENSLTMGNNNVGQQAGDSGENDVSGNAAEGAPAEREARGTADEEAIREQAREDLLLEMKAYMQEENSTVKLLRKFYPGDVIVFNDAQYLFIPLDEGLKKTKFDPELFTLDESTGRLSYEEEEGHFGIDVSKFQGEIDWEKVAEDGVEFTIIRLGLRGYSEGAIMPDEYFENNIDGAHENGIHAGVYFFSQAVDKAEIDEEIEYIFENLQGHSFDGPIVIDIEDVNNGKGRTGQLTQAERTDLAVYFCEEIKARGYEPMIYGNLKSMMLMLDLSRLEDYKKWYAFYDLPIYYPYEYDILQYKDTGKINGIKGDVDFNIGFDLWFD